MHWYEFDYSTLPMPSSGTSSLSSTAFLFTAFLLNQSIYTEISKRSFEIFTGTAPVIKKQSIGRAIKQLYKSIFYASYFTLILALPLLPSYFYLAWIMRLVLHNYLFILLMYELKGSNRGWEFERTLAYIQVNWAYFAGFGLLPSLFCFGLDVYHKSLVWTLFKLISLALLFPLYIIISSRSHPPPAAQPNHAWIPSKLPIFYLPEVLANFVIRILERLITL